METNVTNSSAIRKEVIVGQLTVSRVYKSDYQKEGTLTAELRQEIHTTSYYPSKVIANSLNENIFAQSDFKFEEQKYENKETRVAWIDVPESSTIQDVEKKLAEFKNARLYKILSNRPILADTEKYAINNEQLDISLDTFANRQVVRYPMNHPQAGEITLDINGKVQYRRIAFTAQGKEDEDLRTQEPENYYASPEIEAELQEVNVMESQAII